MHECLDYVKLQLHKCESLAQEMLSLTLIYQYDFKYAYLLVYFLIILKNITFVYNLV